MKKIIITLILVYTLVILVGCGNSKDNSKENSNKALASTTGDNAITTVKTYEGIPLPKDYPLSIAPIISGSKITIANKTEDKNGNIVYLIAYSVNMAPNAVAGAYMNSFSNSAGYKSTNNGGNYNIEGTKENVFVSVTVTKSAAEKELASMVQIIAEVKKA